MLNLKHIGLGSLVLALVACGGETKPAKAPEPVVGANDGKADMPPPGHNKADESTADHDHGKGNDDKAEKKAEKGGPGGGMLTVAAMKWAPAKKGKSDKAVEVTKDGAVMVDGKPAAKIAGDQVQDAAGSTLITVGVDGSLVGSGVKPGLKLQGDELTAESGAKVTVGDDGTVTLAKADGKSEPLGKFEGGASAKRAALLVTAMWLMPADATKADAKKTDAKPADAKKTDAKPTEKAAPKK